jgi:hypothetical protein
MGFSNGLGNPPTVIYGNLTVVPHTTSIVNTGSGWTGNILLPTGYCPNTASAGYFQPNLIPNASNPTTKFDSDFSISGCVCFGGTWTTEREYEGGTLGLTPGCNPFGLANSITIAWCGGASNYKWNWIFTSGNCVGDSDANACCSNRLPKILYATITGTGTTVYPGYPNPMPIYRYLNQQEDASHNWTSTNSNAWGFPSPFGKDLGYLHCNTGNSKMVFTVNGSGYEVTPASCSPFQATFTNVKFGTDPTNTTTIVVTE